MTWTSSGKAWLAVGSDEQHRQGIKEKSEPREDKKCLLGTVCPHDLYYLVKRLGGGAATTRSRGRSEPASAGPCLHRIKALRLQNGASPFTSRTKGFQLLPNCKPLLATALVVWCGHTRPALTSLAWPSLQNPRRSLSYLKQGSIDGHGQLFLAQRPSVHQDQGSLPTARQAVSSLAGGLRGAMPALHHVGAGSHDRPA